YDAFTYEKLKEVAQRGELSVDRGLLLFVGMKSREPLANGQMVDLSDVRLFTLSVVWTRGRQVVEELSQVALIIAQGMRAHVALVAQVVEELSKKLIEHSQQGPHWLIQVFA